MLEETGLTVKVERLLFTQPMPQLYGYTRRKIYLCSILDGEAKPGYESEEDASALSEIVEVKWFDLRDIRAWDKDVLNERLEPQITELQKTLGY
jgi:8-oxo-dGTP pyrophosphatase MutT (NUDIX family)